MKSDKDSRYSSKAKVTRFSNTLEDREESRMTLRFLAWVITRQSCGFGVGKDRSSHLDTSMRCLISYPNGHVE